MRERPVFGFGLLAFGLAIAAGALLLHYRPSLDLLWAWLIAINVVSFLTYGYDKRIAGSERTRVPETILLALVLLGGTVGALLGMLLFRHKTRKWRFQIKFWLMFLLQFALFVAYWVWTQA